MQARTSLAWGAAVAVALAAGGALAKDGGRPMTLKMSGGVETPAGDPDGTGTASLRINPGQMQVCYTLNVAKIAPVTMAHIHKAAAGASGPPVVTLKAPSATGMVKDCATVTRELAQDLIQHPEMYYVNVHNAEFPGGALRAQLSK